MVVTSTTMLLPILTSLVAVSALPSQGTELGSPVAPLRPDTISQSDDAGNRHAVHTGAAPTGAAPWGAARSVANSWSALGPFGGDAFDVSASPVTPSFVLTGLAPSTGSGSLYASNDGGSSWNEVPALAGVDVYDIEFTAAGAAYVGTLSGLWRSTDQGATWVNLPFGFGVNRQVFEVTLDPSNPMRIWVGVADALGSQVANVIRSDDAGATWTDLTPAGAAGQSAQAIAVDPTDPNRIVAGFAGGFVGGALFVSSNGGSSWINRGAGLPGTPVNDLEFDGTRLLVCGGRAFGSQTFGLFESTNFGASWTALHDGSWPSLIINDIEVSQSSPDTIFVGSGGTGVYGSTDGGATWAFGVGGTGGLTVNEISEHPSLGPATVFVGATSNAVLKSNSGGATFFPSSTGIAALNVFSIASNPNNPFEIAIAFQGLNNGGVFTSVDGGSRWSLEPLPGTRYEAVKFSPSGELYAISDGPTTIAPEGLYRRAGPWTSLGPDQGPQFESELAGLAFSESDPDLIITTGSDFGVTGNEATIWRSTDRGATWNKVFEDPAVLADIKDVEIVQDGTNQVAVACSSTFFSGNTGGVFRSADGGSTWALSTAGLPALLRAESICASPSSPSRFFITTNINPGAGLYETLDAGLTWQLSGAADSLLKVECSPVDPDVLYVSRSATPRFEVSMDGGATFSPYGNGAADAGFVRDIHVTATGDELFAATSNGSWFTLAGDTLGTAYCAPAVPNSTGRFSEISARGSSLASDNSLEIFVRWLPRQSFGYIITSTTQGFTPGAGGSQGTLCLDGSVGRFNQQAQQSGTSGAISISVDLTAIPQPGGAVQVMAGQTWSFQCWHRDANPTVTSNFSNGIAVQFN